MASVFEHTVHDLIKTTSIERVVAPIATRLCHLILMCENGEAIEHADGLERAAEDVEEATRRMADVASRLSVESNDDVTKKEMEPAVVSLKACGQRVLLAALKLRIQPHEAELREELIASTQNVLLGVLKVLLVEDDAAVRKIITAAHWLMDSLSQLEAAPNIPLLLNAFQGFSDALLMLNELAWKRAKDLRDTGQQESVFCSLETLNRSISMLYNAMNSSIKHPQSTEAQAAKKYILDQVASTIRDLVSTLKSNSSGKSLSQKGSYRMKLDGLIKLLDLPHHTHLIDSGFDSLLRDLIIHCMVVANSSHKNIKRIVVDDCRRVLQLWSEISQDTNTKNCPSDHEQMQHNNGDKYFSLKKQLQKLDCSVVKAILYQLLDVFVAATVAFDDLMNAAGQPLYSHPDVLDVLNPLFTTFVSHTDKMIQVAGFISSLSTNAKHVENVENSTASLQRLKNNVKPLLLEIKEHCECARPLKKLENLHQQWVEETSHFIDALSYIVDVKEFIGLAAEEMKNQRYNCDRALNIKSPIQFNKHTANLIGCMNLVAQAVRRHINKNNNPIFRNGLLVLVKQVEASIDNVRASIRDISTKQGFDIKSFALFSEKTSAADEQFHILLQGLNGLQHPHLLSPLREEARQPTASLLNLTTEMPNLDDVPVPEFRVA
uniref:Vinculin n=1 Tax=Scleropages formosus TaxID=113540 RepID=A0A8C9SUV5_SCLFO